MPFEKGQSGNPGGRPKADVQVRELARQHTKEAIEALVKALNAKNEGTRVAAANALLDRGWGKPTQTVSGDGDNTIRLIVKRVQLGVVDDDAALQDARGSDERLIEGKAD